MNAVRDSLRLRPTVKPVPGNEDDLASAERTKVWSAACQCAFPTRPPQNERLGVLTKGGEGGWAAMAAAAAMFVTLIHFLYLVQTPATPCV